ncbi:hypothetical protein NC653_033595 [Populus alba x Populus x berolinensis]|uniref:Uncharacterized protein n=1 Tax=Populus alba x Populus x berolinensis TaxID=444605 RepID=A0AAD6LUA7_9ROSI|nr:hypothetical protein NC653_033595 [Populus alba x Populus x berolinensis]
MQASLIHSLQFGDASGIQSPVSFGGFGSLTRHLGRLSAGVYEAINGDFLDASSLSLPKSLYVLLGCFKEQCQPRKTPMFLQNLLMSFFMSISRVMQKLGDPVLRPFLQDVIQFWALSKTLGLVMLTKLRSSHQYSSRLVFLCFLTGPVISSCWATILFSPPMQIQPFLTAFPSKMKYEWKRYLEALEIWVWFRL